MNFSTRLSIGVKALKLLGFSRVAQFAKYQFGLRSGSIRLRTPLSSKSKFPPDDVFTPHWFFQLPNPDVFSVLGEEFQAAVLSKGNEIVDGKYRPFGNDPQPLDLELRFPVSHWTFHEIGKVANPVEDIKLIWEPARLGWAVELGKAFYLSKDERYAGKFIDLYQDFRNINPLNLGPNWQSAQEVALRLMALVLTAHLMHSSKSLDESFMLILCKDIADHAERILPTISYAKAQDNNHLLSEAVGLYTAGLWLKDHPRASKWTNIGRNLFRKAILGQIEEDGEYCQHSTNYHRMMLTLALWMRGMLLYDAKDLEVEEYTQLKKATSWLLGCYDEVSGNAMNLGHNDGAFIFPLANGEYADYRPIIQSSGLAFLNQKVLTDGAWNDLAIWLGLGIDGDTTSNQSLTDAWPKSRIGDRSSWANLRAAHYRSRPAHADQLHVDLWFKGHNVLMDAGTYLYNAQPPWTNALSSTIVHNTICVDGCDQMMRAGRFLWLDWAQANILKSSPQCIKAEHDGYLRKGIIHHRELKKVSETHWEISDELFAEGKTNRTHEFILHWLVPDWLFKLNSSQVELSAPFGRVVVDTIFPGPSDGKKFSLIKAGETLAGDYKSPILGWYSPTYNLRIPALSLVYQVKLPAPVSINTTIKFMEE